ncbi:phosphonate C-P lyase system protein PhnH [Actinoplanes sp. TBRC 11911]|uniref:phosphonate C-P lyase system protein PhnH n=1 Tax=Actinoplanes sp. TBRC 11911 TaxID=2729386 RepID=UPI00145F6A5F|nr:phosphonate C-P lyase system protein PhnH [Actinoplanes sp. TBRC 11911]NMO49983.1 phosphonate C-P lyase system protein PhnH [Actinoplanes sp. TBRC 11911]
MTEVLLDRIAASTLRPDESWQVFRAVLDALARPGTVVALPKERLDLTPAALLPMLSLADLGTPITVLDDDEGWAEIVGTATSAPAAPLGQARLVAATRTVTPGELRAMARGSAFAPEESALVSLSVPELEGTGWTLSGPGVSGIARLAGLDGIVSGRAGLDLLLVTPDGRMAGIPRSTTIDKEDV